MSAPHRFRSVQRVPLPIAVLKSVVVRRLVHHRAAGCHTGEPAVVVVPAVALLGETPGRRGIRRSASCGRAFGRRAGERRCALSGAKRLRRMPTAHEW